MRFDLVHYPNLPHLQLLIHYVQDMRLF